MNLMLTAGDLAKGWIKYWRHQLETGEFPDTEGNFMVDRLVREEPEIAWSVILAILGQRAAKPPDNLADQVVANREPLLICGVRSPVC